MLPSAATALADGFDGFAIGFASCAAIAIVPHTMNVINIEIPIDVFIVPPVLDDTHRGWRYRAL
jgi:hypothetical protein